VQSVLGTAGDVTHELLVLSVDVFKFVPLPGLQPAAQTLLIAWDAVMQVDVSLFFFLRRRN
jgi:abelson tyrosine-protein kinase 1